MKVYFMLIFLIAFAIGVKAQNNIIQTITGKVYRAGTDSVIAGATVYYGSSIGSTATDGKGFFRLTAKSQQIPIIVSCIGYNSATANFVPGQPLIIYLKPTSMELQEVVVSADDLNRKEEIKEFIPKFLGTSKFAMSCTITNLDNIKFSYNKKTQTLKARCSTPIIIENRKLGYTISYYLDRFEAHLDDVIIFGNCIFKDNVSPANLQTIQRNREDAYSGSKMQFIRALWHNTLTKTNFNIYWNGYHPLMAANIKGTDKLQQQYLHLPEGGIRITNSDDARILNILTQNTSLTFIDKDGYYGEGLIWGGGLGLQRVGDLLPFEYQSKKDQTDFSAIEANFAKVMVSNTLTADVATKPTTSDKTFKNALPAAKSDFNLKMEKTFLHTDRGIYTSGDTLWFKAYLVNAQDNTPANSSGNLHVELISPDNKILSSELIQLENGLGNGDFDLSDTLAAGTYRLRAYTIWMRNFGDNFIFEKEISILGDSRVATPAVAVKHIDGKIKPATATATSNIATINFYPEGGSLISGVSSIVGVKAEDGKPAKGAVISASGDTVARFNCDSLGMGMFVLLPQQGQVYRALVKGITYPLPGALHSGLALQVRQADSLIRVVVSCTDTTINRTTLKVKHAGITLISHVLNLTAPQMAIKIPDTGLPEGICAITLYDEQNRPNCERLIYIHHRKFNSNLTIKTDKSVYAPKEKINVVITAEPNSNLSVAITDAATIDLLADNIVSNLLLSSELRGPIEHPARYFDTTNINRFKQLDLLLLTQGWRNFIWRRLEDTAIRISYAAERNIAVSGKVEDEVTHTPMTGLFISLQAEANQGDKLFAGTTDNTGRFSINGLNLYGRQSIALTSTNTAGKRIGSFIIDTLNFPPVRRLVKRLALNKDTLAETLLQKISADLKKANLKRVTQLKEVKIKDKPAPTVILNSGEPFKTWGPPQVLNVTPNDYHYKTLQWFLLQKFSNAHASSDPEVTGVVLGGAQQNTITIPTLGGSSGRRIVLKSALVTPLLFVNGFQLGMDDPIQAESYRSLYYLMPVSKFKKIVLQRVIGMFNEDKYLLYLTMIDNYTADNPGFKTAEINTYYQARTFYQPLPGAKPLLADYRTTIYWQPNLKTDATGKANISFFNNSCTQCRVIIQGLTNAGIPIFGTAIYEVK